MFHVESVFRKSYAGSVFKPSSFPAISVPISKLVGTASRHIPFRKPLRPIEQPLISAVSATAIAAALRKAELLRETRCGMQLFLYANNHIHSPVLQELGRLREITFRMAGEGTGKALDVDRFDTVYQHIILWHPENQEICGAYRLGDASTLVSAHDVSGVYCSDLFELNDAAATMLQQGIELGRSFIQAKYQGTRALDYLWQGIGTAFERMPHSQYAFGAVSLSADYGAKSSADIIAHFQHYYGATDQIATPLRAYKQPKFCHYLARFNGNDECADFRLLKLLLSERGQSVPMLFKQYSDLCEPGGVNFMAYSIDPDFGSCIDAFVTVDINKIKAAKKARYFPNRG